MVSPSFQKSTVSGLVAGAWVLGHILRYLLGNHVHLHILQTCWILTVCIPSSYSESSTCVSLGGGEVRVGRWGSMVVWYGLNRDYIATASISDLYSLWRWVFRAVGCFSSKFIGLRGLGVHSVWYLWEV